MIPMAGMEPQGGYHFSVVSIAMTVNTEIGLGSELHANLWHVKASPL